MTQKKAGTSNRGFAAMDPEKQRAIAKKGGKSVPNEKRSFSRNRMLAAEAGRKGGESVPDRKRSFSQNPTLASVAGRKGGQASGGNFAHDRERASEAGRKGGQHSHGTPPAGAGPTKPHNGEDQGGEDGGTR